MRIQSFLLRGKWHLGEEIMSNILLPATRKIDNCDLSGKLKSLNAECRNCAPVTPFECLSGCRVYLLKSELRHLWEVMANPNYIKELFNVLKNKPRLHVMQTIVKGTYSSSQLQQEIERAGHDYRQNLLGEECLPLLMEVGLAACVRDNYRATTLGIRLTKLFDDFLEFADKLPNHSECYEEAVTSWKAYWQQRHRWAFGHMQVCFKHGLSVIKSKKLTAKQKLDCLLLLHVYFMPVFTLFSCLVGVPLILLGASQIVNTLWFFIPISLYSFVGNFAPFFEVGIGAYLDGRSRIQWLCPLLIFLFFFNMLICTKAFFDLIGEKVLRKNQSWAKTMHVGTGDYFFPRTFKWEDSS